MKLSKDKLAYPVADVLNMSLTSRSGVLAGSKNFEVGLGLGVKLPLTVDVTSGFVSEQFQEASVICEVVGNLMLIVKCLRGEELHLIMVDYDKVPEKVKLGLIYTSPLDDIKTTLGEAVAAHYTRKVTQPKWQPCT